MAVRKGSLVREGRWRVGALPRAAALSLLLHLGLLATLGGLAQRHGRSAPAPTPTPADAADAIELAPVELALPTDLPSWPGEAPPLGPAPPAVIAPPPPPAPVEALRVRPRPQVVQSPSPSQSPPPPPAPAHATATEPDPEPGASLPPPPPTTASAAPQDAAVPADATLAAAKPEPSPAAVNVGSFEPSDQPVAGPAAGGNPGAAGGAELGTYLGLLKDLMQAQWRPKEVYGRLDPKGRLEGAEFSTILTVRMRADGTLERVDVRSSSGIAALDNEAVEAFKRAQPLPRVPTAALDAKGGFTLQFGFHLDVAVFHFAAQLQRILLQQWRPSPAFRRAGDKSRSTIARVLLSKQGVLIHAMVRDSAGMDFLDAGVMTALKPGLQLPVPPPSLASRPGLVPVDIEFLHRVRDPSGVRMLRSREIAENK